VFRIWFLMQHGHRFRHVIHRNNIDAVRRAKRQQRQAREKHECADHIELRGFRAAAIAEHDTWTKHGARNIRKKFAHHVLAEFFRARVRIVVGAVPVNGKIFRHHFMAAMARDGHGGNLAEPAQAVGFVCAPRKLRHFQSPAQINVEAALLGFAVERCGAMNHGFRRFDQMRVIAHIQPEARVRQISAKNGNARCQRIAEMRKVHVQLHCVPKAFTGFLLGFRAHQ
jgi:hypothetical protein